VLIVSRPVLFLFFLNYCSFGLFNHFKNLKFEIDVRLITFLVVDLFWYYFSLFSLFYWRL